MTLGLLYRTIAIFGLVLVSIGCRQNGEEVWLDDLEPIPVTSASSTSDPALYSGEPLAFADYFERTREVQLSDELVFGERATPFIGPTGQILMLDGEQAGLFEADGRFITQLDPEPCNPGMNWQPELARFLPSGGFLVQGYSSAGMWFDDTGQCSLHFPSRGPWMHSVMLADSSLLSARFAGSEWFLRRISHGGQQVDTLFFGHSTLMSSRIPAGGIAAGPNGDVFIALGHSPFIYRYRSGRFEKLGYLPDYYSAVDRDFSTEEIQNPAAFFGRVNQVVNDYSLTGWLYALTEELLAVRFSNAQPSGGSALHIMDLDGNPITRGPLYLGDLNPSYISDGSMYVKEYDESGLDDAPLNPRIVEYRFIGR